MKPTCSRCRRQFEDYGAIALSIPTFGTDFVEKIHICPKCWPSVAKSLGVCPHKWEVVNIEAKGHFASYIVHGRGCTECGTIVACDGDFTANPEETQLDLVAERIEASCHWKECWDGAPQDRDDPDGAKWDGCCCKCVHQLRVMSHPWYNGLPVSHQIGWACVLQKGEAMMLNCEHGMCECFERKKGKEE